MATTAKKPRKKSVRKPANTDTVSRTREKRKKVGRPSTVTPQNEELLLRLITEGNNVVVACDKAGITYSAVKRREETDAEFTQRLAQASFYGTQYALARAEDRLEKATPKNISVVREIALHWRWVASKLLPVYRDRVGVALQAQIDVAQRKPTDMVAVAQRIAFIFAEAQAQMPVEEPETLRLPAPAARPLHEPDPGPMDNVTHPGAVEKEVPAAEVEVWVNDSLIERECNAVEQDVNRYLNPRSSTIFGRRRR